MTEAFTNDDLDVLSEALEAWESKGFAGQMMGDIFGMMLTDKHDPVAKLKMEQERRESTGRYEREMRVRKERSLLLRAKLITLKRERGIAEIAQAINA